MNTNPRLCKKSRRLPLLVATAAFVILSVQASAQKLITIDVPDAGTLAGQGTFATTVNPEGAVTGYYIDSNNTYHAFLRTKQGIISTFNPPGTGTGSYEGSMGWGINPAGAIAGVFWGPNCLYHGYVRTPDGNFETFDAPGAGTGPSTCTLTAVPIYQGTIPGNMNPKGEIAGTMLDKNYVYHGFVRTADGKFETIDPPDAGTEPFQGTWVSFAAGLTDGGTVTGWYIDGTNITHGYVRTKDGEISTFDGPGEGVLVTMAFSTNSRGETVGFYVDADYLLHGFLRTKEGKITTTDVPFTGNGAGQGTQPEANNNAGVITGNYIDANYANHGYVLAADGRITAFDPLSAGPGAGQGTIPIYINQTGAITGSFMDTVGVSHGFLRMPR